MYNIAYLRETVRRMVHRVYLGRKCTIYLPISVPRYLRDRGHETDTLVPRISRSIGLASSAARPTPDIIRITPTYFDGQTLRTRWTDTRRRSRDRRTDTGGIVSNARRTDGHSSVHCLPPKFSASDHCHV